MKLLLISANRERSPYPVAPLGLAYVGRALSDAGHEVTLTDLCFSDDPVGAARRAAEESKPDFICLSIRNVDNLTFPASVFYLPQIKEALDAARSVCGAPVVVGGSGFSLFPEETLAYLGADYGVVGEGEEGAVGLVDAISNGKDLSAVPNTVYRSGDSFKRGAVSLTTAFTGMRPARELLQNERYLELGGMANVQTKRGCPFDCTYCTYPVLEGRSLRLRDPFEVAEEVQWLYKKFGIDYIFFVDDIFNVPESHAVGICEEMIKRDLKVEWTCFATPGGITRECLHVMKRAGCTAVEFGTDGGTEATLEGLGKGFGPDDVLKAQRACDEVGLSAAHYLILGGPGETEDTLRETFAFMEEVSPKAVIAMIGPRIYPETGLHKRAIEDGLVGDGESILEPTFYIAPAVKDTVLDTVRRYAEGRKNWIVPGLGIRSGEEVTKALRLLGKRGALWDLL